MFIKKFTIILVSLLLYQSPLLSKSNSFNDFDSKNLSNYFSGILALGNKNNSQALNFFNSSKILIDLHDPYLEKFVTTLVLENKVSQAINIIKINAQQNNSEFFEAYILLALDSLKKNNVNKAIEILSTIPDAFQRDRFNFIIVNLLMQYADIFKNKEIKKENKNFGSISLISETFQRCYLNDENTDLFFSSRPFFWTP